MEKFLSERGKRGCTFEFITLLRGVAVLLIAWDHMIGSWLDWQNVTWMPLELSRQFITKPLGIIQDFGAIGVSFLFLISGFLITYVGQTENRRHFSIKRLLRIYPPLITSIIIIFVIYWTYGFTTQSQTYIQDFSFFDILLGFSLLNYFFYPQNIINGIAWILVVEGLFYVSCFIILPFIKKRPKISMMLLLACTTLIIAFSKRLGTNFLLFASSISFFPFILMGQILFYFWSKRISKFSFVSFSLITMLVYFIGVMFVNTDFLPIENSYIPSFIYAYFIFGALLIFERKIYAGRFMAFFSKISYSFYLNQTYGYLWVSLLLPLIGIELSVGTFFIILTFIAYLSWRFIESPSRKLAKKII